MVLNKNTPPVLDLDGALARVGGDRDLLREIGMLFLEEYPPAITELRRVVAARDPGGIERKAHSLKGSVSTFGTGVVFEAAVELERQGRSGDLAQVESNLRTFEVSLVRLCKELQALIAE